MQKLNTRDKQRRSQSTVSPQFLLRVGGLPINTLDDLRLEETTQWLKAVLSLETLLVRQKDHVVDALHEAVSKHKEDQTLRRKLINLKRDIYNMHIAGGTRDALLIADALSTEGCRWLNEWMELWYTYQDLLQSGSEILARELSLKRTRLKEIIDTPDFRKGILLSSPLLDQAVTSYLFSDNRQLNREARTVERSLVEYLLRTACKTSPFSTFTPVCIGTFDYGETVDNYDVTCLMGGMEQQSYTRLNVVVLSRLSYLILISDEIKPSLPVRLTPGWRMQGNRIKYLRRKQNMDEIDEEASISLDIIHENVLYLPAGQLLQDILDLLGDGHEAKLEQLVSQLCAHARYQGSEKEVNTYLQRLLRLGFLIVPNLQLDIHSKNPLTEYRKGLLDIASPLTNKLAHLLEEVELLVVAYATAPLPVRRDLLTAIKQHIKQCFTELGQPQAAIPRTVLYEDTTIKPQKLTISHKHWNGLLSDLADLQIIFPIFDSHTSKQLITRGYFRARYGSGHRYDDFLSFAEKFNADYFEQHSKDSPGTQAFDSAGELLRRKNHFHLPELDMLYDARQAVADYIHAAFMRRSTDSKELILDHDFLEAIASLMPKNTGEIQSHSFFSQFARNNDESLLVINQVYPGLSGMFSRFAHCFTEEEGYQLVPALRADLEKLQPDGALFAELKGGYDATNLNLHPAITPYELVCPGEVCKRPQAEQIPLEDLSMHDDEQAGRLRLYSKRLDKEIIPLYLGFLVPMLLPEIQQVLLNFSPLNGCQLSLWDGAKIPAEKDTIVSYPRLRYKNIVLQRAMWKMPASSIPQRTSGQSDADYYLAISRWRKEHDLPSRVFFVQEGENAPSESNTTTANTDFAPLGRKKEAGKIAWSRKPQYVDFENYFSLALLEATLRKLTNQVVFSEMLPDRDDLWFNHNGNSYVSEFVFELNVCKRGCNE